MAPHVYDLCEILRGDLRAIFAHELVGMPSEARCSQRRLRKKSQTHERRRVEKRQHPQPPAASTEYSE